MNNGGISSRDAPAFYSSAEAIPKENVLQRPVIGDFPPLHPGLAFLFFDISGKRQTPS